MKRHYFRKYFFVFLALTILAPSGSTVLYGAEAIALFPETPYDRYIVYQNLVIFWLAIIGLVVIIRMKLKEIERTQKLGLNKEEKEIPFLE